MNENRKLRSTEADLRNENFNVKHDLSTAREVNKVLKKDQERQWSQLKTQKQEIIPLECEKNEMEAIKWRRM